MHCFIVDIKTRSRPLKMAIMSDTENTAANSTTQRKNMRERSKKEE